MKPGSRGSAGSLALAKAHGRGVVSGCTGEASSFLLGNASWHPPAGRHSGQGLRGGSGPHEPRLQRKHLRSRAPGTCGFSERRGRKGTGQRQRLAEPPADPHPRCPSIHPSVGPSIHSTLSRCPCVRGPGGHLGYRVRDAGPSPRPGDPQPGRGQPPAVCRVSSRRLLGPFVFGRPASQRRLPQPSERISARRARRLC